MANYGTEIVWGLVRTAWGSLTSEFTRLPTLARHFFIFEVELVAFTRLENVGNVKENIKENCKSDVRTDYKGCRLCYLRKN